MSVKINRHGEAMTVYVAQKTIHGRVDSFMGVKVAKKVTCGIIDIAHQDHVGPSRLQPRGVGSVHLNHLAPMMLALSPLIKPSSAPRPDLAQSPLDHPLPQRLAADA